MSVNQAETSFPSSENSGTPSEAAMNDVAFAAFFVLKSSRTTDVSDTGMSAMSADKLQVLWQLGLLGLVRRCRVVERSSIHQGCSRMGLRKGSATLYHHVYGRIACRLRHCKIEFREA